MFQFPSLINFENSDNLKGAFKFETPRGEKSQFKSQEKSQFKSQEKSQFKSQDPSHDLSLTRKPNREPLTPQIYSSTKKNSLKELESVKFTFFTRSKIF